MAKDQHRVAKCLVERLADRLDTHLTTLHLGAGCKPQQICTPIESIFAKETSSHLVGPIDPGGQCRSRGNENFPAGQLSHHFGSIHSYGD